MNRITGNKKGTKKSTAPIKIPANIARMIRIALSFILWKTTERRIYFKIQNRDWG
jgi:hypothetical protein